MKVTISFKHLQHTESLDVRIREKTKKLEKYLIGVQEVHWICTAHQGEHIAEIRCKGPSYDYHATGKSSNLYKSLDKVISKLEAQVRKKKEQWKNHKNKHNDKYKGSFDSEITGVKSYGPQYVEGIFKKTG